MFVFKLKTIKVVSIDRFIDKNNILFFIFIWIANTSFALYLFLYYLFYPTIFNSKHPNCNIYKKKIKFM